MPKVWPKKDQKKKKKSKTVKKKYKDSFHSNYQFKKYVGLKNSVIYPLLNSHKDVKRETDLLG